MMTFGAGVPKSGMMEIGIALVLHDRFSNQAAQASGAIRKLQQEARMAVQANLNQAYQFGTMGLGAFTAMASGVADMISYGAEFVDTMTTVEAITGATTDKMTELKDIAMSLGAATMFSSQDVASGMKYLAMAGNTAEQIQSMIKGATYAAGATGMELGGKGGAADVITNVMRTFQLEGEKAAMMVGDVMTNATLSANISMQDLAASIRYAAADMTNLGYELPEVAAAIGTLGDMGIQGSMAGTALANMARYLNRSISDPSYRGHKFLEKIGLSKDDLVTADGHLKDLYSILMMIKNATDNMDATDKNLITTGIFGVRGNRAAVAIMRDMENFRRLYLDVANTKPGFAQSVVEKRMATIAGQLDAMKSTWENLKSSFTEALAGFLIPVFKTITAWIEGMQKILGTGVGRLAARLAVVSGVLLGIGSALVMIRSRIMMLRTDSLITGKNMFTVLVGGWRAAYLAAADYARMEQLIINQRKAGIFGQAGAVAMGTGYTVKGIAQRTYTTKTGKKVTQYYNPTTGKIVSKAAASAAMGAGAATVTTAVVGKGLAKGAAIGGKLLGFGSKLLSFLGGWPGLLLTIGSIAIPALIGAIGKKKESQQVNTQAMNENTAAVNTLAGQYATEAARKAANRSLTTEQELRVVVNLLGQLVSGQKDKNININLRTPNGNMVTLPSAGDSDETFDLSLN